MDVINVMNVLNIKHVTTSTHITSSSEKKKVKSNKGLKIADARDYSKNEQSARVTKVLKLCGIDTDSQEKFHQKMFRSKFAIFYLMCITYVFALRIVSLCVKKNIIHVSPIFSGVFCFGIWLSVQINSNKIVALEKDINVMIRKDDLRSQNNLSYKLMGLLLILSISAALIYIFAVVMDIINHDDHNGDIIQRYYNFGVVTNPPILSIFLAVVGGTATLYSTFVIPLLLLFVYNFSSECVFSMLDSFRIRSVSGMSKENIDAPFNEHRRKLKVVQQLQDAFSVPLFFMFTKQFYNCFLLLSLIVFYPDSFGRGLRWFSTMLFILFSIFSLFGTIVLSSRISSSQQDIKDIYRTIYEDRIYSKQATSNRNSSLLRAIIEREVIYISAGNMVKAINRNVLTSIGAFLSYAALIITSVQEPQPTVCVSVINNALSNSF